VPSPSRLPPRGFGHVETWVFDLDNTLYPHHLNLWQQVDERIRAYVSDFLKVSKDEAFRVQKDYYRRYGTTSRGFRRARSTSLAIARLLSTPITLKTVSDFTSDREILTTDRCPGASDDPARSRRVA